MAVMETLTACVPGSQIIYVDDGSKDASLAILRKKKRAGDIVVTKQNGGKGSAIREGLRHVTGEFTVIQDADHEYDPKEITLLLREAERTPGTIVFGSRFLKPNPNLYPLYLLGNKTLSWIADVLFGGNLSDTYTCYKLFPTPILRSLPLTAHGFELEAELSCWPLKLGHTIVELPISYNPRSFHEGKKIGWKDAVKGIWTMVKIRCSRGKRLGNGD